MAYAGKPEVVGGNGAKFYIPGTDEYTKYLVNRLSHYTSIQGCNISMDRYFTSIFLAEWASQRKFTIVGTMRHDRKDIPKEVKVIGNREEKSVLYVYRKEKNIMLASYIDKKKSGKKNVIVLSTMHDSVKVTNDQRKKPQILSMHDHKKGGIDVVDLLSTSHSSRIKSKRWPINAFAFILDTCQTNAKTILHDNDKPLSNFEFTYAIEKGLPAIQRRYASSNGLQIAVINKMHRVLRIKEAMHHAVDIPTKSGRCFKCIEAIMGSPKKERERNRLNNKLKRKCFQCNKYVCKVHQVEFICGDCKQ